MKRSVCKAYSAVILRCNNIHYFIAICYVILPKLTELPYIIVTFQCKLKLVT